MLLNDLEATGYSLAWLAPEDLSTLNDGSPAPQATQALIAAGTGLGEAMLDVERQPLHRRAQRRRARGFGSAN